MIKTVQRYKQIIQVTFDILEKSKPITSANSVVFENETSQAPFVRYNNNSNEYNNQTVVQMNQNDMLEQAKQRGQQLRELEIDIVDLNSMMKDLAIIVHEQGDMIGIFQINFIFFLKF
jgi:hypothetical protein